MKMADVAEALKAMTVQALRELARKQLGPGYSRLKTKSQLVKALAEGIDKATAKGLLAKLTGRTEKRPAEKRPAEKKAPPSPAPAKREKASGGGPAKAKAKASSGTPEPQPPSERSAGGGEPGARPIAARPAAGGEPRPMYDERLGELPDRYEDDAFVALPLDPKTLFVYWDFAPGSRDEAARGLRSPRALLGVYAGGERVREVDFALESRQFYLSDLPPGRIYHAEIHFVGEDGTRRRLGRPSNAVALAPLGPSSIVDDRFVGFWSLWDRGRWQPTAVPGTAQPDRRLGAGGPSSWPPLRPWLPGGVESVGSSWSAWPGSGAVR